MGRATNAGVNITGVAGAGAFATARRGGLTLAQVNEIKSLRAKARPTPFQAIAMIYGVAEADIRALVEVEASASTAPPPPPPPQSIRGERFWTQSANALLQLAYCEAGHSTLSIAAMLGCLRQRVDLRVKEMGLVRAPQQVAA